ncbi:DUF7573 domain-containing protein [Halovivax cerinus]|uniref:DUF7573 domain-containing protein n=1 Tax=Halovivax cerinus TaxID=1487865 RepID=A0ABD5NTL8_9EURY|nr:hypothetical protein [Halovivax cerinus]
MKRSTLSDFAGSTESHADGDESAAPSSASAAEPNPDGDESPEAGGVEGDESADAPDVAESESSDGADRPTVTLAVGQGRPCAHCGRETSRQWRTESGFVCPECIEW